MLVFGALGLLWIRLLLHLRIDWSFYPQYAYGWAVPFLAAHLIFRKAGRERGELRSRQTTSGQWAGLAIAISLLALLWLPSRLLQEANPEWRLVTWALAGEVVGLTLFVVRAVWGPAEMRGLVFPLCYFLVAVPWPGRLENITVQGLTRANIAGVTEVCNWIGIPALAHGNLIEVGAGTLGVNEACSGIRSFQATLMISLFLGEFYGLAWVSRAALVGAGFLLSFVFNGGRTFLLVWVAARRGMGALSAWHDPAGVSILVACFVSLWVLARSLRKDLHAPDGVGVETEPAAGKPWEAAGAQTRGTRRLAVGLIGWLIAVEVFVWLWYCRPEAASLSAAAWTVQWPNSNPTWNIARLPQPAMAYLRIDEGWRCSWQEPEENRRWEAMYLCWEPGRPWAQAALGHDPEGCQVATGWELVGKSGRRPLELHGVPFETTAYKFRTEGKIIHVIRAVWGGGRKGRQRLAADSGWRDRVRAVWSGRRNPGVRVLELALRWDAPDEAAEGALVEELGALVRSMGSGGGDEEKGAR